MANEYSGTGGAGANCFNLSAGAGTVAGATTLTGAPCISLVAGTNITLTGASPNQITIASAGGGGGGTVSAGGINQVAYYAAAGTTVSGSANFLFDGNDVSIIDGVFTTVLEDAATNTVSDVAFFRHNNEAAAAVIGLGTGISFQTEGATAGVAETGSRIASVWTAGAATAEQFDMVFYNMNGDLDPAATNEVMRITSVGGFSTTSSVPAGTTVSVAPGAGGDVTVGGTGGLITTNGPITAVGALGTVAAATTVTAGTGITATAGNIVATVGNVIAADTVEGVTVKATGILLSQRGIQQSGVTPLTASLAGVDFSTLGGTLGVDPPTALNFSVIELSGVGPGEGVNMTNPNDGDFLAPAGSKWTITAMTAGLFVAFDNALNPEYATQANAAIKQVLLLNIGDAVTFFTPDGIKWDFLSTAFTAAAAF